MFGIFQKEGTITTVYYKKLLIDKNKENIDVRLSAVFVTTILIKFGKKEHVNTKVFAIICKDSENNTEDIIGIADEGAIDIFEKKADIRKYINSPTAKKRLYSITQYSQLKTIKAFPYNRDRVVLAMVTSTGKTHTPLQIFGYLLKVGR